MKVGTKRTCITPGCIESFIRGKYSKRDYCDACLKLIRSNFRVGGFK